MDHVRFRFDAIVFDFDGVLVESVDIKTQAFAELYRPYGEAIVKEVAAFHLAHCGVSRYDKFRYFHGTLLGQKLTKEGERQLAEMFSNLVEDAVVAAPWVEGAHEFVEAFWQRVPLYIASATPTEELNRIVCRRGMQAKFREVAGSPQTKGGILKRFILAGDYVPERVLMIGDALLDFEGAAEAGAEFLGRVPRNGPNPFPPSVRVVEDLRQLASCLPLQSFQ